MRLIGWLLGGIEAAGVLVVVVLAPIASIYAFVTGEPGQGLLALGLFAAGLAYFVLGLAGMINRPWARRRSVRSTSHQRGDPLGRERDSERQR